ncbi:NFACT RNA binding domain-containing protein [Balneola sp. MJW-20]|uniref:NFACT RNA binding domain-containing protein n=1 Tax=Gracilimonas aurantiaca TaxID=3234185 RepID=UPI003466D477
MNFYEIIYLKRHLKNKLSCSYFLNAITPYKNLLEIFFEGEGESHRLIFSSSPSNTALFMDTYRPGKKSNALTFFDELKGKKVTDVRIPESDRWVYIDFEEDMTLYFRLFSNRSNVFLTQNSKIVEVFKEYDEPGSEAPDPQVLDLFSADPGSKSTKNKILTLDPMFPRQNIQDLIEVHELDSLNNAELVGFVKGCDEEMRNNPSYRLLANGNTTLFGQQRLPSETVKNFDSVNDLISWRYKNYSNAQRLRQKRSRIESALDRKIKRLKSSLGNLQNAEKGLDRAQQYEQWGHMLMANAHISTKGEDHIEVTDLYSGSDKVKIPIQADLDLAANAQRYYSKSKNTRQSYEEAKKRIPKLEKEKETYLELARELESQQNIWELNDWIKEHETDLEEILQTGNSSVKDEGSAFYQLSINGYQCWIGKNARSNDKLLQAGHKEDIWMHARGVPGSHLLIRMENDKGMPQKKVLLEAASYAAYQSKARGSKLAPVIITKKKYVRKPKGAPPGAVLIDKEEVEMVSPKKPEYE